MIKAFGDLGYDAINLSFKDFYKGGDFLKALEKKYNFNFLSGNIYYENGKAFALPFIIKTLTAKGSGKPPFKKLKVAVIGLGDEREKLLPRKSDEVKLKSTDPVAAAKKIVPKVRGKVDLVILAYSGKYKSVEKILSEVKGIDVVVMGGEYYSARRYTGGDAVVVSTPSLGKHFGRLALTLNGDKKIISHDKKSIPMDETVREDEKFVNLVKDFEKARREQAKKKPKPSTSR